MCDHYFVLVKCKKCHNVVERKEVGINQCGSMRLWRSSECPNGEGAQHWYHHHEKQDEWFTYTCTAKKGERHNVGNLTGK